MSRYTRLSLCLVSVVALGACGPSTVTVDSNASEGEDMEAADMGSSQAPKDMAAPRDMGAAAEDMSSSAQDMNTSQAPDLGSEPEDMGSPERDMDSEPDMSEPWPMYSGEPCDVDGVAGVCLPTSRCGGQSVPGHCPGPSDMQCCLQACDAGAGAPGRCTTPGACSDWAPSSTCVGPAGTSGCCALDDGDGTPIGTLWNTYYYLAVEGDYQGADDTAIYDARCQVIANVPASFSDSACIEGSGRLEDGRVVNYARTCSCGRPCPTGGIICYAVLDAASFPWGQGARSNALEPLRSLAVDRDHISLGTTVYLKEWDGFAVPTVGDITGFTHDGCFRADDVGGAIQGNHIDIFSGSEQMWQRLESDFPTNTQFTAFTNAPKCDYLRR